MDGELVSTEVCAYCAKPLTVVETVENAGGFEITVTSHLCVRVGMVQPIRRITLQERDDDERRSEVEG